MNFLFFISYFRSSASSELEHHKSEKRARLSLQLGFVFDVRTLALVGWIVTKIVVLGEYIF